MTIRNISLDELNILITEKAKCLRDETFSSSRNIRKVEKIAIDILAYCKEYNETLKEDNDKFKKV